MAGEPRLAASQPGEHLVQCGEALSKVRQRRDNRGPRPTSLVLRCSDALLQRGNVLGAGGLDAALGSSVRLAQAVLQCRAGPAEGARDSRLAPALQLAQHLAAAQPGGYP